ncbi:hypothetical protein [Acrocarpospora macrocephala]|nr:hypothetical protein [Acrocarpospora macrocephala]
MRLTRSMISTAIALLIGIALPLTSAQPASARACSSMVNGSYKAYGTLSVHVRGTSCSTRKGHLTLSNDAHCCPQVWVKVERQLWGSYGWLTTHKQSAYTLWRSYAEIDTATVPSRPSDGDERFHACWAYGDPYGPEPGAASWNCAGWVD